MSLRWTACLQSTNISLPFFFCLLISSYLLFVLNSDAAMFFTTEDETFDFAADAADLSHIN